MIGVSYFTQFVAQLCECSTSVCWADYFSSTGWLVMKSFSKSLNWFTPLSALICYGDQATMYHNYEIAARIYTLHQLGRNKILTYKEHFFKIKLMITGFAYNVLAPDWRKELCNKAAQRKHFALFTLWSRFSVLSHCVQIIIDHPQNRRERHTCTQSLAARGSGPKSVVSLAATCQFIYHFYGWKITHLYGMQCCSLKTPVNFHPGWHVKCFYDHLHFHKCTSFASTRGEKVES